VKWPGLALSLQALAAGSLEGQGDAHRVRWWEAVVVVGAIGTATLLDRGIDDWMQDRRSARSNAWARAFRHGGQPEVFISVSGGILVAGVVTRDVALRRSGARVLTSVVTAQLTTLVLKEVFGRVRPADTRNPYLFRPFSRHEAFGSGHTTTAFAFAAALSEEIGRDWATALLYAGAAGTGWSRMNDRRHWLSDVLGGAAVGITAAKVIEGRWRIFGLGPPRFLVDPGGESRLVWSIGF
jgi:membrane-associated phospholipid phosphatase